SPRDRADVPGAGGPVPRGLSMPGRVQRATQQLAARRRRRDRAAPDLEPVIGRAARALRRRVSEAIRSCPDQLPRAGSNHPPATRRRASARPGGGRVAHEPAHAAAAPRRRSDFLPRAVGRHPPGARRTVSRPAASFARTGGLSARLRRSEQFFSCLQALVRALARAISQPTRRGTRRNVPAAFEQRRLKQNRLNARAISLRGQLGGGFLRPLQYLLAQRAELLLARSVARPEARGRRWRACAVSRPLPISSSRPS